MYGVGEGVRKEAHTYLTLRDSYNLLIVQESPLLLSFNRFVRGGGGGGFGVKQVPVVNVSNCPSCLQNLRHPSLSSVVTPCRSTSCGGPARLGR